MTSKRSRRSILKAGLGALAAGPLIWETAARQAAAQTPVGPPGLQLDDHGPIYEAGPDKALDLTDAVTLEAWVKADPMSQDGGRILDKLIQGTSDGYTLDTCPGNSLRIITRGGICRYDAKLAADHWTYVAGVYSASQKILKLYVDGKEVASVTQGDFPPMTVAPVPLRVGADPTGANRFHGRILRAAVSSRALTADEIARRAAGPFSPAGIIAEWQFPEKATRMIAPTEGTLPLRDATSDAEILGQTPAPVEPLSLWYPRPARQWLEALPIGNGRLGAMVFGGVDRETLQLNEDSVWAGGPHDYDNPDGLAVLPEIRRLVFAGKFGEAGDLVNAHFMGRPPSQMPYQPVCNLTLTRPMPDAVSGYRRELNLTTAVIQVTFTANGARHTQEVFASHPDQVIVVRLTADKPGQVSFTAALDSPQKSVISDRDPHTIVLNGVSGNAGDIPGSVKFQALAHIVPEGGQVGASQGRLTVTGADAVTLLISIGTSYNSYKDVGGDPASVAASHLRGAARKPFAQLRRDHLADYQPLFQRVTLDLAASDAMHLPTDARVAAFADGHDPQLAALHFQYGRYLLLSCSRGGSQPANLQGLWNESMGPPWGSKFTVNINTEMNYWPAAPANMIECYTPLFSLIQDLSETGARTAKVQYGAEGWVCHHNTDGWRGTAPVDYAATGMWPSGGAWLCKSFWDHYEFTGDKDALRRHYPVMKGAAEFFLDTLVEEPTHHWLVTNPSISPEIGHPGGALCAGPTMDMEILRDLFHFCAQASELFGVDAEFRAQVLAARARLAPLQIGRLGQLQEWLEDWDGIVDVHNRHISHLYALYPSSQITRRGTPELFAAAHKSLEIRGDEATGWSLAWKLNCWARFEDGDHAFKLIQMLLTPDRTAPNLFDLHPPFQIDGNFGYTSGVCEMLLGSHAGELHLLPALPSAWPAGHVAGLRARGGFEVALSWRDGRLSQATFLSHLGQPCKVRRGEQVVEFPTQRGKTYTLDGELKHKG